MIKLADRYHSELFRSYQPKVRLSRVCVEKQLSAFLSAVVAERKHFSDLRTAGLAPTRLLLFTGPSGTGKTMSAHALAGELEATLWVLRWDKTIRESPDQTSDNLRRAFEQAGSVPGVYLFEEINTLGYPKAMPTPADDIVLRRTADMFAQHLEHHQSYNLVIGTSSSAKQTDQLIVRRFEIRAEFRMPSSTTIMRLLYDCFRSAGLDPPDEGMLGEIVEAARTRSHAAIVSATQRAIKEHILSNKEKPVTESLISYLRQDNTRLGVPFQ